MAQDGAIKAIERSTIHQIQSGQVIVDLCSVAKELVENSVDARATAIDVRFKNQGLDAIEVQDNGYGISPENYESIALKHYTSKLSTYDDLSNLQTFGFRGEALSSLCALSNFHITTCTQKDAPRAKKLEFESSGKLKSTSIVSGQKGTTVVVESLFHNLPVRRRELERNIKREWAKVINQLNQYACIQTGIKFTVSQQPTKGKRMVLFSTKGNPTTRENIINVFGVKTMAALVPLDLKLELTPTTGPPGKGKARADGSTTEVRVQGHVSRPVHGEGRQTPDRQMFYINGRPCGLPQFAKVFNEVYRSYNNSQSPFIFADIQLDTHLYDVNVSPDKRTILLHDQGQMLDNLRESLIELFEMQDVTIPIAQTQTQKLIQTPLKVGQMPPSSTPTLAQGATSGGGITHRTPATGLTTSNLSMADRESEPESDDEGDGDQSGSDDEEKSGASRNARRNPDPPKSSKSQTEGLLARWLEKKSDARDKAKPRGENKDLSSDTKPQPALNTSKGDDSHDDSMSDVQPASSGGDDGPAGYQENKEDAQTQQTDDKMEMEVDRDELPVPAIPPPSQPPTSKPGFVPASRMLNRSTQEVATITIGEDSVTSIIGSTAKRPRIAEESSSAKPLSSGKPLTRTVPLPSFGGRLSQLFSASAAVGDGQGGDLEIETEDVEISVDEEEEEGGEAEEDQEGDSLFVSQSGGNGRDGEQCDDTEDRGDTDLPDELKESELGDLDQQQDEEMVPSEAGGQIVSRESSPSAHCEHADHDNEDEYFDEDEKKAQEDQKVQQMINAAEATASKSTEEGEKRTQIFLKGRQKRKYMTLNLVQHLNVDNKALSKSLTRWIKHLPPPPKPSEKSSSPGGSDDLELEEDIAELKLALKISKSDFAKMRVVGQFNLGFVLAVREKNADTNASSSTSPSTPEETQDDDELFIIDQHASDEKYNFERLQSTTTVQSQRLVQPKTLELTALEEEIILENLAAFESNGFSVQVDQTGDKPVGSRCLLTSLPLSRETTFSVADLEELIFLLSENPTTSSTTIPRPSKVRKMFAMRACRSSIMIGRALSRKQMEKVVRHMGEMEKPWNCPHGRPTMRHLCGLGTAWDQRGWVEGDWAWACSEDVNSDEEEGDGVKNLGNMRRKTDWAAWVREKRER